jgi:hypothetical protein
MSKLIFALLLAASLNAQGGPHCRVLLGVQMPTGRGVSKVVIYFLPPFKAKPDCSINFGEATFLKVETGWVEIAAKPDTRVDFGCVEHEGGPR